MVLPLPDDVAAAAARDRLASIDIGICAPTVTALGMLAEAVVYIAGVQGSAYPRPLLSTRVVLLTGAHAGGLVAGPTPDPRNGLPLQHLAVAAGAGVVTLEWQPAAAAIELEDAVTPEQMDAALRAGWDEAERAADEGIELLVLAAGGPGAATAAAAVVAAATGAEPTALLGRVVTPAGYYDDNAWMTRCLALRDALHRVRNRHGDPRTVLAALGGADIAAATGLILGAANRKTPVMIDGPVGAAAAVLANDFSAQSSRWVMLPDAGRQMTVRFAAEALGLRPWFDLCLDLGEGATALAALPMLQTALTLAGVGEPVEPMPMSRFDSTGNQVFVGVARPVEPSVTKHDLIDAESELVPDPVADGKSATVVGSPSADDTAFVVYSARGGAAADGEPAATVAGTAAATAGSKSESAKGAATAAPRPDSKTAKTTDAKSTDAKSTDAKSTDAKSTDAKSTDDPGATVAGSARPGSGRTAAHKQVPAKAATATAATAATRATPARPAKGTAPAKAAAVKASPAKAAREASGDAAKDATDSAHAVSPETAVPAAAGRDADTTTAAITTATDTKAADTTATDTKATDTTAADQSGRHHGHRHQSHRHHSRRHQSGQHHGHRRQSHRHHSRRHHSQGRRPQGQRPQGQRPQGQCQQGRCREGRRRHEHCRHEHCRWSQRHAPRAGRPR